MKAIVVAKHGGIDGLQMQDIDRPTPNGRQVLVRVHACGVCRRDILVRRSPARPGLSNPLVLGHEIAGTVETLGPDARGFSVGDRVVSTQREFVCGCCTMCRTDREALCADLRFLGQEAMGGNAEFVAVMDDNLAKLPANISFEAGSIVGCPVGTSYNAVIDTGDVRPGERVLLTGMGGLGIHAVQIARACGAYVIAATRSADKAKAIEELGADCVVVADDGRFARGVRDATGGRGVDVAIDTVGSAVFHEIRRSVVIGGRVVLVGEVTGTPIEIDMAMVYRRGLTIRSATSTSRRQLGMALKLVEAGSVKPIVERTMPLADAALAHRMVEENAVTGRIVLTP
jgi:acryloyl-coenzyme A reductase